MSRRWRYYIPGYLMALPHTIVGLALAVIYRAHSWQWVDGRLECIGGTKDGRTRIWGRPGAQTHGWLIVYASAAQQQREDLRVHEVKAWSEVRPTCSHTGCTSAGGICEVPSMSLDSRWRHAYRGVWAETQAYRVQAGYRRGVWGV